MVIYQNINKEKMKLETQKKIWESLLYFLLLLACILLIINYILFKSDAGECVKQPKEFLIKHFEKLTGGNITCTCLTDHKVEYKTGSKIIFSSYEYDDDSGFTGELYENVSINSSTF